MKSVIESKTRAVEYIISFGNWLEFPKEAVEYFVDVFNNFSNNETCYNQFAGFVLDYFENIDQDFPFVLDRLSEISAKANCERAALKMLYLIFLSEHLADEYKEKGISEEIYRDSMLDLKWKLFECKRLSGKWGILVAWWTVGFFNLKLFGLGRLQFNLKESPYSYHHNGFDINAGDLLISTHIPSSGPLIREEYLKSYQKAEAFFAEYFNGKPTVFFCYSWLMHPNNRVVLPAKSNILDFMDDWTVIFTKDDPKSGNAWNIFGVTELPDNLDTLPKDTSMQRNYIEWLKQGHNIGTACAVMLYKNGNIIK